MSRIRNWLLAGACVAPLLGWAYQEYVRPAMAQCPGVNCIFNGVIAIPSDGVRQSYVAASNSFSIPATALDIAQICGSSSKTIRVTQLTLSGAMSTALNTPVTLVKRSTASSQPGSLNVTPAPIDSGYGAATTTPITFPTQATLGTAVVSVDSRWYLFGNITTTGSSSPLVFTFGTRPATAVVLRGAAQCLAVNLNNSTNATVTTGALLSIAWEWTEE